MTADDQPAPNPRCTALTRAGDQCTRRARQGELTCKTHQPAGKPRGRKTKLTAELTTDLEQLLAAGNYREQACNALGIHPATLYRWLERADADEQDGRTSPYRELRDAVTRAEAGAERDAVTLVRRHAVADWRAAAWYLERRHPSRWGRRDRLDVDATVGQAPKRKTVSAGSGERAEEIRSALAEALHRPAEADENSPTMQED
jgi:hypothetical protein